MSAHKNLAITILPLLLLLVPVSAASGCTSSLRQSDCRPGEVLTTAPNGCPECRGGVQACQPCSITSPCAPGLVCEPEAPGSQQLHCGLDKASCHHVLHLKGFAWTPDCLPDGTYAPKQCRGDRVSGRCFCYSAEGERIFGWGWRRDEEDMNCLCSRRRHELEVAGEETDLHCRQNGNYEEIQCSRGFCWCVDEKGAMNLTVPVVSESMRTFLPCHNETSTKESYLRQCESITSAQRQISTNFLLHGTHDVPHDSVNCGSDGSYGVNKILGRQVVCAWRTGDKLGTYEAPLAMLSHMDCSCARDTKIFELSNIPFKMTCDSRGSYDSLQFQGTKAFCVDSMGYSITELMESAPAGDDCSPFMYDKITTETFCKASTIATNQ